MAFVESLLEMPIHFNICDWPLDRFQLSSEYSQYATVNGISRPPHLPLFPSIIVLYTTLLFFNSIH